MSWPRGIPILANKGWLIVTASVLIFYYSADIYSFVGGGEENHEFIVRSKRSELDPVQAREDNSADPSFIRKNRRILNETDSFTEVDGKKKPIQSKDLNKEYQEAKQRFLNPAPKCVNRTDAAAPAGDTAPAAPAAAEAPAADPPAEGRRRRRREAAKVPFCDELNKAPAGSGGGAAAPAPAPDAPAETPAEPPPEG